MELPILDRYSTGSQVIKGLLTDAFVVLELQKKDDLLQQQSPVEVIQKKKTISLKEIDDKLMTIDDFLN